MALVVVIWLSPRWLAPFFATRVATTTHEHRKRTLFGDDHRLIGEYMERNADWWAEHHSIDQALRWSDVAYDQLESLANFPESNGLSAENDDFPYEIRDKLVGLGSRPGYRAVFTIKDDTVYVLTIRLRMPSVPATWTHRQQNDGVLFS